jgi:putative DNA primase/helicase
VVLIGKLAKFNFAKRTVYLCHSTLNNGAPNSRQAQIRLAFLLYAHGADVREALWRGGEAFSETLKDAVDFFETLDHSDIKLAREELHKTQLDSALFESLARKLARQFGIPKDELRQRNVDSAARSAASEGGTPTNIPATAESWGEPVKANEVLDDICKTLARFVWMKPWQYKAVALWVALTYLHDATDILPLLLSTSPEEECGKTTLLELVFDLSNRPIISSNISAAAIYRTIRDICPTLTLDEADTYMADDEVMRGVINSGHNRSGAFVIRVVGVNNDTTAQFSTWCPKAIAMIGLPKKRTTLSRSIHIRLGRKNADAKMEKLRRKHYDEFEVLRRKISRLANQIREQVKAFVEKEDDLLGNRAGDNRQPLFAIANAAGEDWLKIAQQAAQTMTRKDAQDSKSFGRYLLESLDRIIRERRKARGLNPDAKFFLKTRELVEELNEDDEAPWKERPNDDLSVKKFGAVLSGYDVKSKQEREGAERSRGYFSDDLERVIQQYVRIEEERTKEGEHG